MTNCKNCNHPVNENYCSHCGQAVKLKRIDNHYISHEVLHLLHFEKGFFYTAKQLITRPGNSIREYILENRNKHMKPVPFLILTSLLYSLIAYLFHVGEIYNSKEQLVFAHSNIMKIQHWVQTHYGYSNILMGAFVALFVQLFFRKYKYNLYETTVLLCFVMGQGMLLLIFGTFFIGLIGKTGYLIVLLLVSLVYPTWAIGQFFDGKAISYVKAFFAYFLGYFLFQIVIVFTGLIADAILN